jgi:hypothetical protein
MLRRRKLTGASSARGEFGQRDLDVRRTRITDLANVCPSINTRCSPRQR